MPWAMAVGADIDERFLLFSEADPEISAEEQRAALVHSLERVTVGVDLGTLHYRWRDQP